MEAILNLSLRAKSLNVNDMMRELANNREFTDYIVFLNTENQLYDKGIDSKNITLGEYLDSTIEGTVNFKGKKEKGQRYDHVTLKDTGEFYNSFKAILDGNSDFIISADTIKDTGDLIEKYGSEILGLNSNSLEKLAVKTKEILIPYVKKILLTR